jgi:hypothetical protein
MRDQLSKMQWLPEYAIHVEEVMNALLKKKGDNEAFTPEIDRRIIEGFLNNQKTLLATLTNEQLSKGAILKRAGELGLNKEFFTMIKRDGVEPEARKCLRCGKYFASVGAHNRLCTKCRKE